MTDKTIKNARNLRRDQTDAEQKLWSKLRNRQFFDLKFRRQHPYPPYILDFYCDDLKLVIELDGGQHSQEKDQKRTEFLVNEGLTVLRYWNNDVLKNIDGVLEDIENKANIPSPLLSPQGEGVKDRICVAKIATAHGIKGLVKLHIFVDNIDLVSGDLFTSEQGDKTLHITLKNATAKHWLAEIKDITDRNAAEALRGTNLYIDKSSLPEADEDEFYFSDLIGLPAIDTNGQEVGKIIGSDNFGAGDLLEIQPAGAESFYLPVTDETVLEILDNKIIVSIPEGLIE